MYTSNRVLSQLILLPVVILGMVITPGCLQTKTPDTNPPDIPFHVYFNNDRMTGGNTICDAVFPVARSLPDASNLPATALEALFLGPTPEEEAMGFRSFFSAQTAGLLKQLNIKSETAYVDLHDKRSQLSGITSSCGSAEFFSQIRHTLIEYPSIQRIIFAIEGNPAVFYDWLELECDQSNDNCDPTSFASP